jgi:hypothetical protein
MSNSLAESFIIVNSIFFGVSDIGISTVVQQAAFYSLINQGNKPACCKCCRYVLLDRLGGHPDRLVDRFSRNDLFPALLADNLSFVARKQS